MYRLGGGATDAFVGRLTPSGSLNFSTLIGGSGSDSANGLALKTDGSVWVVGETTSSNLPLIGTPYQSVNKGSQDALLARVTSSGSITYTSYFGGSGEDRAVAVALDAAEEVYLTGNNIHKLSRWECLPKHESGPSGLIHCKAKLGWLDDALQHVPGRLRRSSRFGRSWQLDRSRHDGGRHCCRHYRIQQLPHYKHCSTAILRRRSNRRLCSEDKRHR